MSKMSPDKKRAHKLFWDQSKFISVDEAQNEINSLWKDHDAIILKMNEWLKTAEKLLKFNMQNLLYFLNFYKEIDKSVEKYNFVLSSQNTTALEKDLVNSIFGTLKSYKIHVTELNIDGI